MCAPGTSTRSNGGWPGSCSRATSGHVGDDIPVAPERCRTAAARRRSTRSSTDYGRRHRSRPDARPPQCSTPASTASSSRRVAPAQVGERPAQEWERMDEVDHGLVPLRQLVVGQAGLAPRTVRRHAMVLDEQTGSMDLLEGPPDGVDVLGPWSSRPRTCRPSSPCVRSSPRTRRRGVRPTPGRRALNSATPYASMSCLPVKPSSCSTASSTGKPCSPSRPCGAPNGRASSGTAEDVLEHSGLDVVRPRHPVGRWGPRRTSRAGRPWSAPSSSGRPSDPARVRIACSMAGRSTCGGTARSRDESSAAGAAHGWVPSVAWRLGGGTRRRSREPARGTTLLDGPRLAEYRPLAASPLPVRWCASGNRAVPPSGSGVIFTSAHPRAPPSPGRCRLRAGLLVPIDTVQVSPVSTITHRAVRARQRLSRPSAGPILPAPCPDLLDGGLRRADVPRGRAPPWPKPGRRSQAAAIGR